MLSVTPLSSNRKQTLITDQLLTRATGLLTVMHGKMYISSLNLMLSKLYHNTHIYVCMPRNEYVCVCMHIHSEVKKHIHWKENYNIMGTHHSSDFS